VPLRAAPAAQFVCSRAEVAALCERMRELRSGAARGTPFVQAPMGAATAAGAAAYCTGRSAQEPCLNALACEALTPLGARAGS
jgi:hypothetical protein